MYVPKILTFTFRYVQFCYWIKQFERKKNKKNNEKIVRYQIKQCVNKTPKEYWENIPEPKYGKTKVFP